MVGPFPQGVCMRKSELDCLPICLSLSVTSSLLSSRPAVKGLLFCAIIDFTPVVIVPLS